LITHAHGDHIGNVPSLARSPSTEVVAVHEVQQYLLASGLPNVTGMNIGGTYTTKGLKITMTQAVHSSSIQNGNEIIYGGVAAGFVIRFEDGTTIYHAGDTALFGDMALIGELYHPKIAMLPIGDHYVMGPREAAHAAKLIRAEIVIPMHYSTFPVLTGTVAEFQKEADAIGVGSRIVPLAPGEGSVL
ncbi:MAG: metal-dependent hydrolase, partial [Dissulfurimicrobium sp.]